MIDTVWFIKRSGLLLMLLIGGVIRAGAAETLLRVTPEMLSGPLVFFATPAVPAFAEPIPFGFENNLADRGWIWPRDNSDGNSGYFVVDFGSPTAVTRFRVYCSYNGGERGSNWAIEYSDDNANFTKATDFPYHQMPGAGVDDGGNPIDGFGGWYETKLNPEGKTGRYWRIRQTAIIVGHDPRSAQVEFYGSTGPAQNPSVLSTAPLGNTIRKTATIKVELQDGAATQVAPASIQLLVNGQAVTPVASKPAGSNITTLNYDPKGALLEGLNKVRVAFSDTASPANAASQEYSFVVINDVLAALVINIDLNGVRNDPGPDVLGPTFSGQGAAGGGGIWNGITVDSRTEGGGDDNDNLTITGSNLLDSIGGATTVGFSIGPVGGDVGGAPTTNPASSLALFSDYVFVGFAAQISFTADFTITGLSDVPTVDLYFHNPLGTIKIPGAVEATPALSGLFNRGNTHVFLSVPVSGGAIKGTLSGDAALDTPARLAGLTVVKPPPHALVRSVSPTGEARRNAVIKVELQDNVSLVVSSSIRLEVNGQAVLPNVSKTAPSDITTVTYDSPGPLPEGLNTARIVFRDNASTPLTITNDFTFIVVSDSKLIVPPQALSGPLVFFASPAGLTFKNPIPYGIANNVNDIGWIWPNDNTGELQVDFGAPQALNRFRVYSTYPGGARGANWSIEYSSDKQTWTPSSTFPFETKAGGGVNGDGSPRTDAGGWYGIDFNTDGRSARYWRVIQTDVTMGHAPRAGQVEFYAPAVLPTVESVAPVGLSVRKDAPIVFKLQDNQTQVAPGTIKLSLDGQSVTPVIEKPAGSKTTTVTYDPPADFSVGSHLVQLVFGNDATPSVSQTEEYSFVVAVAGSLLDVIADDLSGPLVFFASPANLTFKSPIPYGITNNVSDSGWIWPNNNSGSLQVDLLVPTALNRFRVYSTYAGGSRGANWAIEYSNDGLSWGLAADFPFTTLAGAGANDDGTKRADFGGWYEIAFNDKSEMAARFWRVRQTKVLVGHAPRCGQFEFYGTPLPPLMVAPGMLSGPLKFFASPAGLTHSDPVPYGIANNVNDNGWIWPQDNSGLLAVNFGQPTVLSQFRVYSTYPGGGRGALWAIEYSHDDSTWSSSADFLYETKQGAGVNSDGSARSDFGGWYGITFNDAGIAAKHWRIRQVKATVGHAPRCGQFEFYGVPISPLSIGPEMLSGSLNFFASPAGLKHANPIPYGIANNVADNGWIWPQDNSGLLAVDFGQPQPVNIFRVYSSYPGDGRGALWAIEYSSDNANWTLAAEYPFETKKGFGVNDDGSPRTDFGGWYQATFNPEGVAARYWRVRQVKITVGHAPRAAEVEFYAVALGADASPLVLDISAAAGGKLTIAWSGTGTLESSESVTGPWSVVPGASPQTVTPTAAQQFYRLRK